MKNEFILQHLSKIDLQINKLPGNIVDAYDFFSIYGDSFTIFNELIDGFQSSPLILTIEKNLILQKIINKYFFDSRLYSDNELIINKTIYSDFLLLINSDFEKILNSKDENEFNNIKKLIQKNIINFSLDNIPGEICDGELISNNELIIQLEEKPCNIVFGLMLFGVVMSLIDDSVKTKTLILTYLINYYSEINVDNSSVLIQDQYNEINANLINLIFGKDIN